MILERKNKIHGFTLIELLVVIGIIGTLAAVIFVSLNTSRQKSRDTKRVADIRQIITALQLYYDDNLSYPGPDTASTTGPTIDDGDPDWTTFLLTWPMAPIPADNPPGVTVCDNTNNLYTYTQIGGGMDFNLTFCIGSQVGDYAEGLHTATSSGIQ